MKRVRLLPNMKSLWSWLEAILLTSLVLLMSFTSNPTDPFLFHSAFPWLWFAPVLLALRYGMGPGLLSVIIITTIFVLNESSEALEQSFHRVYLLSGFILTLICAEFSTVWSGRVRRAEQAANYAGQRLNEMAHAYHVVSNSHTHLEQSLIAKPVTLRSAVQACVELLKVSNGALSGQFAQRFVDLLAYHCSLQQCALYVFTQNHLVVQPIAHCGDPEALVLTDPLVKKTLEERQASYHAVNELHDAERSKYLVCAPLMNSDGAMLGFFVVQQMPFLALHHESLQLLSVLIGYYANQCWAVNKAQEVLAQFPTCPPEFAAQLLTLAELYHKADIASTLVAIRVEPCAQQDYILQALPQELRGLDISWVLTRGDTHLVLVLMPFSGEAAVAGYKNRIQLWLRERFAIDFETGPVSLQSQLMKDGRAVDVLNELVERVDVR